jgi:hypothetical protein
MEETILYYLNACGKFILAWILENQGGKAWNGLRRERLVASY